MENLNVTRNLVKLVKVVILSPTYLATWNPREPLANVTKKLVKVVKFVILSPNIATSHMEAVILIYYD